MSGQIQPRGSYRGKSIDGRTSCRSNFGAYELRPLFDPDLPLFLGARPQVQPRAEILVPSIWYYTGSIGDVIGLTVAPAFGLAVCWGYYRYSKSVGMDDWSFTLGELTHAGRFHLVYIFFGSSVAACGIGFLASGNFGTYLLVALGGGGFYLVTFALDWRVGHYTAHREKSNVPMG